MDETYMKMAIELAEKGRGFVNPNPMVGAVIVKEHKVIGKGYHERYGGPHGERNALASCSESPAGATLYVNLEPCCHYGKTPPCTEAIIEQGIARVVVGCKDPNPLVAGRGLEILKEHGIEVVWGVLEPECTRLNQVFFHFIREKTPFVVMKYAMTMDGKIATSTGASKWITGEAARRKVHQDRHRYSAIMVGVETVVKDDPLLTCRMPGGRNPIRIVCDTRLRTPLESRIVSTAGHVPTYLATACRDREAWKPYEAAGCRILETEASEGGVDMGSLMKNLYTAGVDSVLLEGGGRINYSALESEVVHRLQVYLAPKIFGGSGVTPVTGMGVEIPGEAFYLKNRSIRFLEEDILIESEVDYHVHRNCGRNRGDSGDSKGQPVLRAAYPGQGDSGGSAAR